MNEGAQLWEMPPAQLFLPADEVHVWRAGLDGAEGKLAHNAGATLSAEEQGRADRFRFPIHRQRYIAARGLLRTILGGYLKVPPQSLGFSYGPHGKPALADEALAKGLRFNVSHAEGMGLFAFAWNRELGVDVESAQRKLIDDKLPERFFSPHEVKALRALPQEQQQEGFFNCWTRKEAYIKATGRGLSQGLNGFDVTLAPGEPARLLATRPEAQEASRWTLREILVGGGFAGAVMVEGSGWRLRCFQS